MTHGRQLASCVARTRDLLAIVLVGIAVIAKPHAAPPENATSEFHDFFERQRIPGLDVRCCSVEDGRVVDYRVAGDHFEVLLTKEVFPWLDDNHVGWTAVDRRSIIENEQNPIGKAVAWVSKVSRTYAAGVFGAETRSFKKDEIMCLLLPAMT